MRFTLASFLLATVVVLLAPLVIHALPSIPENDLPSEKPDETLQAYQACMNDCSSLTQKMLEDPSLIDGLVDKRCITEDYRGNSRLPCDKFTKVLAKAATKILDRGEMCRAGCRTDYPIERPSPDDWSSCYYSQLNETNTYMQSCWDAATTSIISSQFEDACFDTWFPRFQKGNRFCCGKYGCRRKEQPRSEVML